MNFIFFSIASTSRISFFFFFLSDIDNISIDPFKLMKSVSRVRQRSFEVSRVMAPQSKSYSFLGGANFDSFSITFSISFVAASLIFIFSLAFKELNYRPTSTQEVISGHNRSGHIIQGQIWQYLTDQKFHTTQRILFPRQTCQIMLFSCRNLHFPGLSL